MKMFNVGRAHAALRLLLEAGIMVAAYVAYQAVRVLVSSDPGEAFGNGFGVIETEQRLGIFVEPRLQSLVVEHGWLVALLNWTYVWGYLPVISAAAMYLYLRDHAAYTRYRNAFLVSGAAGLIVFALMPVAPPRMFPEFGFVDTVHANSVVYRQFQGSGMVNEYAAVPSFHFGWTLLIGIALVQTSQHALTRALAVTLPAAMLAAIVFTANHYFIDALAGGIVVLGALALVTAAERYAPRVAAALTRWHAQRSARPSLFASVNLR